MKRGIGVLCILILLLAAGNVAALPFTETYSSEKKGQKVRKGESYNFTFDMWYDNTITGGPLGEERGTDSNLSLTLDSMGMDAQRDYASATVTIDFKKLNKRKARNLGITFSAIDGIASTRDFGLSFEWDRSRRNGRRYQYTFDLTGEQLTLFDDTGWANINIASNGHRGGRFAIEQVSFHVNTLDPEISSAAAPVPEPATMLLLGAGLGGIAIMRRKK